MRNIATSSFSKVWSPAGFAATPTAAQRASAKCNLIFLVHDWFAFIFNINEDLSSHPLACPITLQSATNSSWLIWSGFPAVCSFLPFNLTACRLYRKQPDRYYLLFDGCSNDQPGSCFLIFRSSGDNGYFVKRLKFRCSHRCYRNCREILTIRIQTDHTDFAVKITVQPRMLIYKYRVSLLNLTSGFRSVNERYAASKRFTCFIQWLH